MPIQTYNGFREFTYRLMMPYEDNFDSIPNLQTIRTDGTVETEKMLTPQKERALFSYPYVQHISLENCRKHLSSGFIHPNGSSSYLLSQIWPTKYNSSFKRDYSISMTNPNPEKFSEEAANVFRLTCNTLFNDNTAGNRVMYCSKESVNNNPLYVATASELIHMLRTNPSITESMNITNVTDNGFVAGIVDGSGNTNSKAFTIARNMSDSRLIVLYVKKGWETMACVNTFDEFMVDRELF